MAPRICAPVSWSQGVVMMGAEGLCSRSRATAASSLSWLMPAVRLSRMAPAHSTWSLKNSPKFFMYILHLAALTTVTKLPSSMGTSSPAV